MFSFICNGKHLDYDVVLLLHPWKFTRADWPRHLDHKYYCNFSNKELCYVTWEHLLTTSSVKALCIELDFKCAQISFELLQRQGTDFFLSHALAEQQQTYRDCVIVCDDFRCGNMTITLFWVLFIRNSKYYGYWAERSTSPALLQWLYWVSSHNNLK